MKEKGYDYYAGLDDQNFLQMMRENPIIFINKYGDVKNLSIKEFGDLSKSESLSTFFEKLTILNNKNDLLLLNDYEYIFMIYSLNIL